MALAAFMEVLDTSIANVALPYMAGNLGASNDQSTWVLTSYLVSNAIILPISGWLAGALGRKRFFMTCLAVFTVSSLLCGFAPSLGFLLFFRVLQGAGGGGLQPMAQAILADTFPPQQRGLAFALYGITAIMAPTIGPTLGGWITFNYSWRWIFFINLPVGMVTWFLVRRFVEDPPYLSRLKSAGVKLDYIGIALLALGIGALQVLLDKGQEDDWFGSHFITTLVVMATVCLISLVIWEWFQKAPDHRRPHVQELQLREFQPDDVHAGNPAVQQPGPDAAIPADPAGVHLRTRRTCAFGRRPCFADRDAHHGPTDYEDSGALSDRLWLAGACPSPCSIPRSESTCRSASVPPPGCASPR